MKHSKTSPRPLTFGPKLPKATLRKDGRFEAKGVCRITGNRKSFYSRISAADAEIQAYRSYGFLDDKTLEGYYRNIFWKTIANKSRNWQEQVQWAMDKYILPRFGDLRVDELNRRDLQTFFTDLVDRLLPSSLSRMRNVLSCVLNLAIEDEYIIKNPAKGVKLPIHHPSLKKALTVDQLRLLIDNSDDYLKPYLVLCGVCGLRAGEALGTRKSAIRNGVLHIESQVLQPTGGCVVTNTLKTKQSRRQIPVTSEIVHILETHLDRSIYVCAASNGSFITPNNAARALAALCVKVGLVMLGPDGKPLLDKRGMPKPLITPHELRHTFISLMENELEAPASVVSTLAGHKLQGVTAGYSHSTQSQRAKWMREYSQMILPPAEPLRLIETA